MEYLVSIAAGYLAGSLNFAYFIGRLNHIDIRDKGSGNAGASNILAVFGWKAGILTVLFDIFKAFLVIWLIGRLFPESQSLKVIAGCCAVLGHIFPFYMQFRGGKGFASLIGTILALDFRFALIVVAAVVIITLITDHIVIAALLASAATPVYFYVIKYSAVSILCLGIIAVIILYKHKINIMRLLKGEEIGLRDGRKHRL